MQFVIRDLAHEFHKQVVLQLSGEDTEIDKFVVERMMDPLLHLVRNAVSHGIELPKERVAAGKSAEARIGLRARTTGEMVTLEVEDDGRGINSEQVFARARATGMLPDDSPSNPTACSTFSAPRDFLSAKRLIAQRSRRHGCRPPMRLKSSTAPWLLRRCLAKNAFRNRAPLTPRHRGCLDCDGRWRKVRHSGGAVREVLQVTRPRCICWNTMSSFPTGAACSRCFDSTPSSVGPDVWRCDFYALVLEGVHAGLNRRPILGLREIVVRPLTDEMIQVAVSGRHRTQRWAQCSHPRCCRPGAPARRTDRDWQPLRSGSLRNELASTGAVKKGA